MPNLLSRTLKYFSASANDRIDQAEQNRKQKRLEKDPAEILDLSYQDQLEQLQKLQEGITQITTARIRIQGEAQKMTIEADKLKTQAQAALNQGDEELAREALNRFEDLRGNAEGLVSHYQRLQENEDTAKKNLTIMTDRVKAFRSEKEAAKAEFLANNARVQINEAQTGLSKEAGDMGLQLLRANERIEDSANRAAALDLLLADGTLSPIQGGVDNIGRKLNEAERNERINKNLNEMKKQLPGGQKPKLLKGTKVS